MEFETYQQQAHTTADYRKDITFTVAEDLGYDDTTEGRKTDFYPVSAYPFIKIGSESAEVGEKVIKLALRGDKGAIPDGDLIKELGDVLWYVSECCTAMSVSLEYVASTNLQKLTDRANRGKIHGSGDNR